MISVTRSRRLWISTFAVALAAALYWLTTLTEVSGQVENAGPYVPTPQVVVDEMLKMANVGPNDFVIDLGSGDGRIVLTAAKKYKAHGFGVDIDSTLVDKSNKQAKSDGVADRVVFYERDVFLTDFSKATVLTLYLLPEAMAKLRPRFLNELRPGTRIVSHDYHLDDWSPDDEIILDVPEKKTVTGLPKANLYLWVVPAKVEGKWQVEVPAIGGRMRYQLALTQAFQKIEGIATEGGRSSRLYGATLHGDEIRFSFFSDAKGKARHEFNGRVTGDRIEGFVLLAGGKSKTKWRAKRVTDS
ncbi:MAG: SAM-dependent methyltransferase [Candidatus Binatia bacterium]